MCSPRGPASAPSRSARTSPPPDRRARARRPGPRSPRRSRGPPTASCPASCAASRGHAGSAAARWRSAQRRHEPRPGTTSGPTVPEPPCAVTARCGWWRASSRAESIGSDAAGADEHREIGATAGRFPDDDGGCGPGDRLGRGHHRGPPEVGVAQPRPDVAGRHRAARADRDPPHPRPGQQHRHRRADPPGPVDADVGRRRPAGRCGGEQPGVRERREHGGDVGGRTAPGDRVGDGERGRGRPVERPHQRRERGRQVGEGERGGGVGAELGGGGVAPEQRPGGRRAGGGAGRDSQDLDARAGPAAPSPTRGTPWAIPRRHGPRSWCAAARVDAARSTPGARATP